MSINLQSMQYFFSQFWHLFGHTFCFLHNSQHYMASLVVESVRGELQDEHWVLMLATMARGLDWSYF